jgi:hypothetical protein
MEDKNYKDLDEFFKSRLAQKDSESNGWDVPSDSILDNAMEQIAIPKPSYKFPLRILGAILLVSLLIGGLLKLRSDDLSQIEELNKQLIALQVEVKNQSSIQVQSDQSETPLYQNTTEEITEEESSNDKRAAVQTNSRKAVEKQTFSSLAKTKSTIETSTTPVQSNVPVTGFYQNQTVNNNYIPSTSNNSARNFIGFKANETALEKNTLSGTLASKKDVPQLEVLGLLEKNLAIISYESTPAILMAKVSAPAKINTADAGSRFSQYIKAGHLLSTINVSETPSGTASLSAYDNYYSGWKTAIGVGYKLSDRFELKTDLGYSQINNNSQLLSAAIYDSSNELLATDGTLLYSAAMDIKSPTGEHREALLMDVTNANMADGDSMFNTTDIHQSFNVLSLNSVLSHKIIEKNDFTLEVYGGLGVNYIARAEQEMDITVSSLGNEMIKMNVTRDPMFNLNRAYLDGQLGLSLNKNISDNLYIGFNAGTTRSLTSISKSDSATDAKSFINGFDSAVSVGYRF